MTSIERVERRLEGARLDVERAGDTLNIRRGSGSNASKVNVDPVPFVESDDANSERGLAGYVSGIKHVLLEPPESDASDWSFTRAAGRLAAALEARSFIEGVRAAAGSPAWAVPLDEELVFVFLLELDTGIRVLTRRQFEEWTETSDRVVQAARSMLYHKARRSSAESLDGFDQVEQLRVGDGYDAARSLVLDDLFFGEFDESSRLGMPTRDDLFFVRDGTRDGVSELEEAIRNRHDAADYPLTTKLYRLERGEPVAVE